MPDINYDEEIKKLLVENVADTKILREEIMSIKRYMKVRTIISIVWIVLLVLPTVLAMFYIPDIIKGFSTSASMIQGLGL